MTDHLMLLYGYNDVLLWPDIEIGKKMRVLTDYRYRMNIGFDVFSPSICDCG